MDPNNSKSDNRDLLFKIYENLVRTDERLKALIEANKKEHDMLTDQIKQLLKKQEELEERLEVLEKEGVKVGIFWKALVIISPIVASAIVSAIWNFLHLA